MATNKSRAILILTTNAGRFVWWRGLCTLDYIPKGHRAASASWPVPIGSNSPAYVTAMAGKILYDHHRSQGGTL